jgi:hypothetical protein
MFLIQLSASVSRNGQTEQAAHSEESICFPWNTAKLLRKHAAFPELWQNLHGLSFFKYFNFYI